jgi:hypothetical protein
VVLRKKEEMRLTIKGFLFFSFEELEKKKSRKEQEHS